MLRAQPSFRSCSTSHDTSVSVVIVMTSVQRGEPAGVETNFCHVLGGCSALSVKAPVHDETDLHRMIQAGIGVRVTSGLTLPEIGFHFIREF